MPLTPVTVFATTALLHEFPGPYDVQRMPFGLLELGLRTVGLPTPLCTGCGSDVPSGVPIYYRGRPSHHPVEEHLWFGTTLRFQPSMPDGTFAVDRRRIKNRACQVWFWLRLDAFVVLR